jgi:ribonuclease E
VEHALRDAMKRDRARTKILRTSPFGLIEMTRQRIRPSLKHPKIRVAVVRVNEKVAAYLNNQKRKAIIELESASNVRVEIRGSENVYPEHLVLECKDEFGGELRLN